MSAADEKLPKPNYRTDGTLQRDGCQTHGAYNRLYDKAHGERAWLELYVDKGAPAVLAVRSRKSKRVVHQAPVEAGLSGLEVASLRLLSV